MRLYSDLPHDLLSAYKLAYEPSGFVFTSNPIKELESAEYNAYSFSLNNLPIKYRAAKITPKKIGQFVTLWKRLESEPITPFDIYDPFDFYVVSARSENNFGQFIFPKNILAQKGVLSKNKKGGKLAIRVYPPWDKARNKQAIATQKWQLNYFFEIPSDPYLLKKLFSNTD